MRLQGIKVLVVSALIFATFSLLAQTPPWERINPLPFESDIYDSQLLENGNLIAVGSGASIYSSNDLGQNWERLYQPSWYQSNLKFNAVHFVNNNLGYSVGTPFIIAKTTDGGSTWELLSGPAGNAYNAYNDVHFLSADTGFIIEKNERLLMTTDGGYNWNAILYADTLFFRHIRFLDHDNGYIALSGTNYYLRTQDAGLSWDMIPLNIPIDDFYVSVLYFTSLNVGHIAGSDGNGDVLLRTTNGGDSCYVVFDEWGHFANEYYFLNRDTGFMMANVYWYSNSILRTLNAGEDWELITDALGGWILTTMHMTEEGRGVCMGMNGQVFESLDYGSNWVSISSFPFLYRYDIQKSMIIHDSAVIASAYGGGGGVPDFQNIRSDDWGESWNYTDEYELSVHSIQFLDESIGFYCGLQEYWPPESNRIYKTENGGTDWDFTVLEPRDIYPNRIEFINDSIGFVGGTKDEDYGFSLYRTKDCGQTWEAIEEEMFDHVDMYSSFDFYNDSSCIVVGLYPYDSCAQILKTKDLGESWTMETFPFYDWFTDVYFVNPDTGYLLSAYSVYRTLDGGLNWSELTVWPMEYYIGAPAIFEFVGMNTAYLQITKKVEDVWIPTLVKTIDAGDTWQEIEKPTNTECLSLSFFNETEGIWTGESSTIFKTSTGGMVDIPEWYECMLEQNTLHIYPNPSNGKFNIVIPDECESGTVSVYSLGGDLIYSEEYSNEETYHLESDAPSGIYLMTISSDTRSLSSKLIIVR